MNRFPRVISLACVCLLSALYPCAVSAQPLPDPGMELFAHGSGGRLWYAVTMPGNGTTDPQTFVRYRQLQEDWQILADMPSKVLAVGTRAGN